MTIDWEARWKEGRIAFHEGKPNTLLERHVTRLGQRRRVLVPLCGKSEDLAFLAAKGHQVVGIELVEEGVQAFFREHGLHPEISEREGVKVYSTGPITLLSGDVFACTKEIVGPVDALYDRAALVALPAEVRSRYVSHLRSLLAPVSKAIAIIIDYDQEKVSPPPFAVSEAELRELFSGSTLERLEDRPFEGARFREAGVPATEIAFEVTLCPA